jgi:threonine dehydratase
LSAIPPTLDDIVAAARRLAGAAIRTPLVENQRVNAMLGGRLLLKAECLQITGSFKFRGGFNFLSQLTPEQRRAGVVTWSSGNHAQGVAEAARLLGVKATIVMPADAPAIKVANTRASGAEVVSYDRERESREEIGGAIAAKSGATIVPPYDHAWTMTGQGTAGLEIVAQAAERGARVDAVIAPCSGGGLVTGIATAVKALSPQAEVFSAEPAGFDDMARSIAAGAPQTNNRLTGSFCDALLAPTPGALPFAVAREKLKGGLVATDDEVAEAMELAFREYKLVLEPGGAVALACVLKGRLPVAGRTIVVVCSGGNVDGETFRTALETAHRRAA